MTTRVVALGSKHETDRRSDRVLVPVTAPNFPDITLVDIVTAQRALLKHLGVDHLVAVIGPSYGGFQAFQWAVTFPDFMDGIVPVTADFKARDDSMVGFNALIARLETDPNWHGGHCYDHGGVPDTMTRIRVAAPRTQPHRLV